MKKSLLLACALYCASLLRADVTLAPLFRDGAILQRDKPIAVWGKADPGDTISVSFHSQHATATAGPDGKWMVTLAAEGASTQASVLSAKGRTEVRVPNVLVGDVWICSGQSNMEFAVKQAVNAEQEMAAANFPFIRQFKIPHIVTAGPVDDCAGSWISCQPQTVGAFTAAGFFFARDLFQRNGVPVGLINSSWGGTQIESWIGESSLKSERAFDPVFARYQQLIATYPERVETYKKALAKWEGDQSAAKAAGQAFTRRRPIAPEGEGSRWQPGGMYNGMIHPLEPYAIRGFLWYQGEANAARASEYGELFKAMIREWRGDFGQGDLPFYFVQLPNFGRDFDHKAQWAYQREAQASVLSLPATAMAVALDIGDPMNIHPKNKQEVGRRLALFARSQIFGEAVDPFGPVYSGAKVEGGALRVNFTHAKGLNSGGKALDQFDVAGSDGKFVAAEGKIDKETLLVSAPSVSAPVFVRYAWKNAPVACLFNGDGLPAAPFRSDTQSP